MVERRVTALIVQKRNPQRVNVHLDGEFAFGLARIVAAWLQVGQQLSEEKIAQLQAEDGYEVAYQKALNFLSYRPRSEAEVRRNLQEHETPEPVIEYVIERLKNSGLLDDTRFAQIWVENRSEMRPRSRRALAQELRQRGVAAQEIEQSLENLDEEEMAYQAARKQARKFRALPWQDFRQKLFRFLAQRGFDFEVISAATHRVWQEIKDATEEEETP